MLTQEGVDAAASRIALIPFFPSSQDNAKGVVIEELVAMCDSDQQAQWLAARMGQVFKQWPGLGEMRALFCKRFKPADGHDVGSQLYADGFPSEAELGPLPIKGLPAPPKPLPIAPPKDRIVGGQRLIATATASENASLDTLVKDLAGALSFPVPRKPR